MTAISHSQLSVSPADGGTLSLYVSRPENDHDKHVGLLVLPEIWGVNEHIREVANRFARLGYTAVAPEPFRRTAPGFTAPYSDFSGAEHAKALTPEQATADLTAAHAWLHEILLEHADAPAIAAVGFCFGGALAFLANARLPLGAAVCFYGAGIPKRHLAAAAEQHGPVLLFWAGRDAHVTPAERHAVVDGLTAAGKAFWNVEVGQVDHGFFCDGRKAHDPVAAKHAWALTLSFLEDALEPG